MNYSKTPAPAAAPSKLKRTDYYFCKSKSCGKVFYRRAPDDPFTDLASCPYCGAREDDWCLGPDGAPLRDALNLRIPALYKIRHSKELPKWRGLWVIQKRQLPTRTAPQQYINTPSLYLRDVFPRLTHLQRSIVQVLQFLTDSNHGYAAIGLRGLAAYVTPANRDTSVSVTTVRESLDGLSRILVLVHDLQGNVIEKPLLKSHQIQRSPTRYTLTFPEVRREENQGERGEK